MNRYRYYFDISLNTGSFLVVNIFSQIFYIMCLNILVIVYLNLLLICQSSPFVYLHFLMFLFQLSLCVKLFCNSRFSHLSMLNLFSNYSRLSKTEFRKKIYKTSLFTTYMTNFTLTNIELSSVPSQTYFNQY